MIIVVCVVSLKDRRTGELNEKTGSELSLSQLIQCAEMVWKREEER